MVKEERWAKGDRNMSGRSVCGIDEAGRGPIAGPVTAAAVLLPRDFPFEVLDDSKALSPRQRREAADMIRARSTCWALGWATHEEIDEINILRAALLAMTRAVEALAIRPDRLLVDGLYCPDTDIPSRAVVKGDRTIPAISAASILAKTCRDAEMLRLHHMHPDYGLDRHKGYPTAEHLATIERLGVCDIYRTSFAPVRRVIERG